MAGSSGIRSKGKQKPLAYTACFPVASGSWLEKSFEHAFLSYLDFLALTILQWLNGLSLSTMVASGLSHGLGVNAVEALAEVGSRCGSLCNSPARMLLWKHTTPLAARVCPLQDGHLAASGHPQDVGGTHLLGAPRSALPQLPG